MSKKYIGMSKKSEEYAVHVRKYGKRRTVKSVRKSAKKSTTAIDND